MKSIKINLILATFIPVLFWLSSDILFEPFIGAIIYTLVFMALAIILTGDWHTTAIVSIAVSIALYVLARYMYADALVFETTGIWDGHGNVPYLPSVTWGWMTQIIISALLVLSCWFGKSFLNIVKNVQKA